MNLSHSLYIKYGLRSNPSTAQIEQWVRLVEQFIQSGMDKEQAGSQAAQYVFPDYNTMVYMSEADSIESLLEAARRRAGG